MAKKVIIRKLENGVFVLEITATQAVMLTKKEMQELLADIINVLACR